VTAPLLLLLRLPRTVTTTPVRYYYPDHYYYYYYHYTTTSQLTHPASQVPFFVTSGSSFHSKYAGVGVSKVRDLFKQARSRGRAIVFIDEIDAIGRTRSQDSDSAVARDQDSTLNQLLVEMDGFGAGGGDNGGGGPSGNEGPSDGANSGEAEADKETTGRAWRRRRRQHSAATSGEHNDVIVIAATNREKLLDPALLRKGRFDRTIQIAVPDIKGRAELLKVYMRRIRLDPTHSVDHVAKALSKVSMGFSGSDIANLVNEAALQAARANATAVGMTHFDVAFDRVIAGLSHADRVIPDEERRKVAVHEAGHAALGFLLPELVNPVKVTIAGRGNAGGYTMGGADERHYQGLSWHLDQIAMSLGGMAAEEVCCGESGTGASGDLEKVTSMAYWCVGMTGWSKRLGRTSRPST